jgi:hypothetical protein
MATLAVGIVIAYPVWYWISEMLDTNELRGDQCVMNTDDKTALQWDSSFVRFLNTKYRS